MAVATLPQVPSAVAPPCSEMMIVILRQPVNAAVVRLGQELPSPSSGRRSAANCWSPPQGKPPEVARLRRVDAVQRRRPRYVQVDGTGERLAHLDVIERGLLTEEAEVPGRDGGIPVEFLGCASPSGLVAWANSAGWQTMPLDLVVVVLDELGLRIGDQRHLDTATAWPARATSARCAPASSSPGRRGCTRSP